MKYVYILLLALISAAGWSQEQTIEAPKQVEDVPAKQNPDEPLTVVEEQAEFPGGMAAMRKFLAANLIYPQNALDNNLQGKCFLRFVVSEKGKISDVKVMRGVPECPECTAEAVRVVKMMPDWIPAKMKGKAVKSYFNLPIMFKLDTEEPKKK